MTKTDVLSGIKTILRGPPRQIDAALKTILYLANEDRDRDELRRILHAALDYTVHGSLAPGLVVRLLRQCWTDMGGARGDAAPHREDPQILQRTTALDIQPGQPFQVRYRNGIDYAFCYVEPLLAGTLHQARDQDGKLHLIANENIHPLHPLETLAHDAPE